MTTDELLALAALTGQPAPYVAYTLVEPRPYGFGYMLWNAQQWHDTRVRLGLGPDWPSALFTREHLTTCAATVTEKTQ